VQLPRLLTGTLSIRALPLEMVLAEKIVTALARGSANTRWRDFLDLYALIRRHTVDPRTLRASIQRVAQHRGVPLVPLGPALAGFPDIAQNRWLAWLRRQRLEVAAPMEFSTVLNLVVSFTDPVLGNDPPLSPWNPFKGTWTREA